MTLRLFFIALLAIGCTQKPSDIDTDTDSDTDTGTGTDTETDTDVELSDKCLFGETANELLASTLVTITDVGTYSSSSELPVLTGQQFMVGLETEGYAEFETLAEAFTYIDDDLYAFDVRAHHDGASYTWLKWYAGDTQVGYFFANGALTVVAAVSDGDIVDCTVKAPKQ